MTEKLLISLVLILLGTKSAAYMCSKINIPTVIGELLVGILLGPAILGWIHGTDILAIFSDIGVILLLFLAGLESDQQLLKKYFKGAFTVALMGIACPLLVFFIVGNWLQLSLQTSLFLGLIFSATSVSISVQVLREYKKLNSEEGAVILGAAIFDDIVVVMLLSIFTSFMRISSADGTNISAFLWEIIGSKILFFFLLYFFGKYIVPRVLRISRRLILPNLSIILALVLCFGTAIVADYFGMSHVIGAFFIGLILANTDFKQVIEAKVADLAYGLFVPVFFVFIGLSVSLTVLVDQFWLIAFLTFCAILTKLVGGYLGARMNKISRSKSRLIGSGMVSRGEMALILIQIGVSYQLIDSQLNSICIMVSLLTTLCAPFLIKMTSKKRVD